MPPQPSHAWWCPPPVQFERWGQGAIQADKEGARARGGPCGVTTADARAWTLGARAASNIFKLRGPESTRGPPRTTFEGAFEHLLTKHPPPHINPPDLPPLLDRRGGGPDSLLPQGPGTPCPGLTRGWGFPGPPKGSIFSFQRFHPFFSIFDNPKVTKWHFSVWAFLCRKSITRTATM